MGYRGKVKEQEQARALRAEGHTLADIAAGLGVSKSSVSLWVRDVPFTPSPRNYGPQRRRQPLRERRLRQVEESNREGTARLGELSDQAFLAAGAALYAGEGSKSDGEVNFANSDPDMVRFFCAWLRRFFEIDEERYECAFISIRASISTPSSGSGRGSRRSRAANFGSRTEPSRIRASVGTNTNTAASTCGTRARRRIGE
jgi:hypothetical protein